MRLSVWSFGGKTKSVLNNYLRDMTTNYKTSFLLPHDYEIPTFNYPQYVLPPIPHQYKPYTKDIWGANVIHPLKTKITAPAQCKLKEDTGWYKNLFSNEFNSAYYEIEIDLKQIDPTIQSISKFQDAYKTIEISNLNSLQVECAVPNIENFISNRNVNLIGRPDDCSFNLGLLKNISLFQKGSSQIDKINFDNIITLYTDNIKVNETETKYATGFANGLQGNNYENRYHMPKSFLGNWDIYFLLQITKLFDTDYLIEDKIKETYLQTYYTNDVKLKIRFSKIIFAKLLWYYMSEYFHFGNDKDITIDINNPNVLGIRNKSDNPLKITIKAR